jgi:hypothetical protein
MRIQHMELQLTQENIPAVVTEHIEAEQEYDPAILYPADYLYWRDFQTVSLYKFTLLSLGIEPRLIDDLLVLHQSDRIDDDSNDEKLSFGLSQAEFERRLAVLHNIVNAGTIKKVLSRPIEKYNINDILQWTIAAKWTMPEAFIRFYLTTSNDPATGNETKAINQRELKKAKTQQMYAAWQIKANAIWSRNPKLSELNVANLICREFSANDPMKREAHTVRQHIKKPIKPI